jgi:hypothetical protein
VHASRPETGTVDEPRSLTMDGGRFVLRGYRHVDREPVEREHAVIARVPARGLSAVGPLPLRNCATVHEEDGRFY